VITLEGSIPVGIGVVMETSCMTWKADILLVELFRLNSQTCIALFWLVYVIEDVNTLMIIRCWSEVLE